MYFRIQSSISICISLDWHISIISDATQTDYKPSCLVSTSRLLNLPTSTTQKTLIRPKKNWTFKFNSNTRNDNFGLYTTTVSINQQKLSPNCILLCLWLAQMKNFFNLHSEQIELIIRFIFFFSTLVRPLLCSRGRDKSWTLHGKN